MRKFAIISKKLRLLNLKIGFFHLVKDFFKSNQNRYGVYHVYLGCKTKRVFAIACLGKKLVFHMEICEFSA